MRRTAKYIFIFFLILSAVAIKRDLKSDIKASEYIENYKFVVERIDYSSDYVNLYSKNVKVSLRNDEKIEENFAGFNAGDILYISGAFKNTLRFENLGYGLYLKGIGTDYAVNPKIVKLAGTEKNANYYINLLRNKIAVSIRSLYGENYPFVEALLLGIRDDLDSDINALLSKTGIVHIISISGFHIIIVAAIIEKSLFFMPKRPRYFAVLAVTLFYVLLTGMSTPCFRAYFFYLLYVLSVLFCKRYDTMSAGFILASAYMFLNPYIIFNISFCLSFLSVFSIAMYYSRLKNLIEKFDFCKSHKYISEGMALTVSAQILTAPYVYYYFSIFSNVSILSNLICAPLISFSFPFIILSLAAIKILPLAKIFALAASFLIDLFMLLNQVLANLPHAYHIFQKPYLSIALFLYIIILAENKFYTRRKLKENKIEQS